MQSGVLQPLESRVLLAFSATLSGGTLTLTGTEGADRVYLYASTDDQDRPTLVVSPNNGDQSGLTPIATYLQAQVNAIVADGKGADDFIQIEEFAPLGSADFSPGVTLKGGWGDDYLNNGGLGGVMDGGSGDDFIYGIGQFIGGEGNDTLRSATSGFDPVRGFPSTILGGGGNDIAEFFGAGSQFDMGSGHDRVSLFYPATVHGGAGNDRIFLDLKRTGSTTLDAHLYGDDGDDYLFMAGSSSIPSPNVAFLHMYGGAGQDTLVGGSGRDLLKGQGGNDHIHGGANHDTLDGGTGNDTLYGDAGNDDLFGSDGNDILYGGSGNNRYFGQVGIDRINARGGVDQIFGSGDGDILDRDAYDTVVS